MKKNQEKIFKSFVRNVMGDNHASAQADLKSAINYKIHNKIRTALSNNNIFNQQKGDN